MRVVLPAYWVSSGHGLPQVCSRHGQPAADGVAISVPSRPPGWAYALLVVGVLPFVIAVYATRTTVRVPSWPFCARCKASRVWLLVAGLLGVIGGVALVCAGMALSPGDSYREKTLVLVFILVGLFLPFGGLAVVLRAAWASVARARASEDGAKVEVSRAHPRFSEQLAALLAQAGAARR